MIKSLKFLMFGGSDSFREFDFADKSAGSITLLITILTGLLGYLGVVPAVYLVCAVSGAVTYEFVKRMDQGLPLMQITALLGVLQWLVGPWLAYSVDLDYFIYFMRVDQVTYFSYALPGTAAFVFGLLAVGFSVRQRVLLRNVQRSQFIQLGMVLGILGLVSGLAGKIFPDSLAFVFFLVSQLRYVAALYFVFSRHPMRFVFAGAAILPLFTGSADTGLFHDLLLWMGILVCYWYANRRRQRWLTAVFLILGLAGVFTIQGVKKSFRDKVWNDEEGSLSEEIGDFIASPHAMFSRETLSNAVVRINQGWIISAILQNVPLNEPYAKGDTIGSAVTAALVPRLVAGDKATAGGRESFRRFTGLPISDGTSMGISLLGEAYANVGPVAGILVMLLFGGFMSLSYGLCLVWSTKHPTFYFWIPVIFCQTIKAETDLVTVLNHITKGAVVAFGLYWLICVKLFPEVLMRTRSRLKGGRTQTARVTRMGASACVASGEAVTLDEKNRA